MSTKFMLTRDMSGGAWIDSVPFATDAYNGVLAQNVADSVTVPDNYPYWEMQVQCTASATVWINGFGAATVASGAIAADTSQLIVAGYIKRYVKAGQTISFITGDVAGAAISVQFLVAQQYSN